MSCNNFTLYRMRLQQRSLSNFISKLALNPFIYALYKVFYVY